MERARKHQRLLSTLAFGLLALVAELAGGSLVYRIDLGRHVRTPDYASANYYPFLLAGVKVAIALLLARLAWRVLRARSAELAARRLLAAVGKHPERGTPRMRLSLSPRLWFGVFCLTSFFYLVQTDAQRLSTGRWPLFAPLIHSSALPVFAVLAVIVAFIWGVVQRWLADYESYSDATVALAKRLGVAGRIATEHPADRSTVNPRRLFGLAFESRPPPLAA